MLGFLLWGALMVGCFSLTAKAFSEQGVPLTSSKYITGVPARIIGVLCALLGVACLGVIALMALGAAARAQ